MQKVFVITGATSGIGKELVKTFTSSDNIVFAGYRNKNKIPDVSSDNVIYFYIDMENRNSIIEAAKFIKSKVDKIDVLINVAGSVVAGPIEKIDTQRLRSQFDVNVFSHIEFSQNLSDILSGGRIINISSMASFGIFPFISPYCASKRCLDMFFNSLLIENKKNIKVVSIKPGVIATPLWGKSIDENSKYFDNYGDYSAEMKYVIANAQKNEKTGLSPEKVVDVILKADSLDNPKLSYTVGNDAFFASLVSKLPQWLINKIVKIGIKMKIRNSKENL